MWLSGRRSRSHRLTPSERVLLQVLLETARSSSSLFWNRAQRLSSTRPTERPMRRQSPVGVVRAQGQAVLGPRREHAVRLVDAAGEQVVDQHADVRLVAAEDERLFALELAGGVDAGDDALPGGLLVAAGAVDLPGQEQARDLAWSPGSAATAPAGSSRTRSRRRSGRCGRAPCPA